MSFYFQFIYPRTTNICPPQKGKQNERDRQNEYSSNVSCISVPNPGIKSLQAFIVNPKNMSLENQTQNWICLQQGKGRGNLNSYCAAYRC